MTELPWYIYLVIVALGGAVVWPIAVIMLAVYMFAEGIKEEIEKRGREKQRKMEK